LALAAKTDPSFATVVRPVPVSDVETTSTAVPPEGNDVKKRSVPSLARSPKRLGSDTTVLGVPPAMGTVWMTTDDPVDTQ
jgi:hypothetical protein